MHDIHTLNQGNRSMWGQDISLSRVRKATCEPVPDIAYYDLWFVCPKAEAYHGRSALRSAQLFFNFCGAMSASSYRALRLTKHEALR